MKTESIYNIKPAGRILPDGEYHISLKPGETLAVSVEQIRGNSVVLRTEAGVLINATMTADAGISERDMLEIAVSKNSGGYLLYIVDLLKSDNASAAQPFYGDSITSMLSALKAKGVDPKAAFFLSKNNIPVTPDNIESLISILRGNSGIYELVLKILGAGRKMQRQEEGGADEAPQSVSDKGSAKPHNNDSEIERLIKDMLVNPNEQSGAQIKKAITDISFKLSLLKVLIAGSDDKEKKEILSGSAEHAIKQLQLIAEFKRFCYIELPYVDKNGAEKKAELYIQKRPGGRGGEETGSVLLISLDTNNMGHIETLIKAKGGVISFEFRTERKELQQEIKKYDKVLEKAMKDAGYELRNVSVTSLKSRTTVINAEGLFENNSNEKFSGIDVKI